MLGQWETGVGVCYYERPKQKSDFHVDCSPTLQPWAQGYKYEGGWQEKIWRTCACRLCPNVPRD